MDLFYEMIFEAMDPFSIIIDTLNLIVCLVLYNAYLTRFVMWLLSR